MNLFETKTTSCPTCKHHLDMAQKAQGEGEPEEGDYTICLYCGSVLQFTADLDVNLTPDHEIPDYVKVHRHVLMTIIRAKLN